MCIPVVLLGVHLYVRLETVRSVLLWCCWLSTCMLDDWRLCIIVELLAVHLYVGRLDTVCIIVVLLAVHLFVGLQTACINVESLGVRLSPRRCILTLSFCLLLCCEHVRFCVEVFMRHM